MVARKESPPWRIDPMSMLIRFESNRVASLDIKRSPNVQQIRQVRETINQVYESAMKMAYTARGEAASSSFATYGSVNITA